MRFSPAYNYYFSRILTGTDIEGTTVLAGSRALIFKGICKVEDWPVENDKIPSNDIIEVAELKAMRYRYLCFQRCHSVVDIQYTLSQYGFTPNISFDIYSNIPLSDDNGIIRHPSKHDTYKGMHASLVVGYNSSPFKYEDGRYDIGFLQFANSWGNKWGDDGYGYLSYEYFKLYCTEAIIVIPPDVFIDNIRNYWEYDVFINGEQFRLWIGISKGYTVSNQNLMVYLLSNMEGKLLGYLTASKVGKHTVEIIDFFVWPEYRNCGFGEMILCEFLKMEDGFGTELIFGWLANDDAEQDGTYIVTKFFTKRKMIYIAANDCYKWAKGIIYGNVRCVNHASNAERYTIKLIDSK